MNDRLIQKIAEIQKRAGAPRNQNELDAKKKIAEMQAAKAAADRAAETKYGTAAAGEKSDGAADPGFTTRVDLGSTASSKEVADPKFSQQADNSLSMGLGLGAGALGGGALGAGAGAALAPHIGVDRTLATLGGLFGGGVTGATLAALFVRHMNTKAQTSAKPASAGDVARFRATSGRPDVRSGNAPS